MNQTTDAETPGSRWKGLYKAGGVAALITEVLFLIAIIDLIITGFQPGIINGWLSLFQNNWLVVIFKLHAGFNRVQPDLWRNMKNNKRKIPGMIYILVLFILWIILSLMWYGFLL